MNVIITYSGGIGARVGGDRLEKSVRVDGHGEGRIGDGHGGVLLFAVHVGAGALPSAHVLGESHLLQPEEKGECK